MYLLTYCNSISDSEDISLDTIALKNSENLEKFRQKIVSKIRDEERLEKRTFFVSFIEDLVKDLCQNGEFSVSTFFCQLFDSFLWYKSIIISSGKVLFLFNLLFS